MLDGFPSARPPRFGCALMPSGITARRSFGATTPSAVGVISQVPTCRSSMAGADLFHRVTTGSDESTIRAASWSVSGL